MAYIGQGIKEGTFSVLDTSGNTYNGSNVTFNLGTQVGSPAQLLVSHDGVIQKPGTDYSLATGGTQITFSTAPASGASIFIVEISGAVGGPLDSDLNGTELILDADGDTSITADTDDQIDVKIAGADDFKFSANAMNVLSGSTLTVDSGATITNSGTANGFGTDPDGAQVFNESGADVDFRVETNSNANMFVINGGNNIVGIGADPDLGVGLHIKLGDSGASVDDDADALVIEDTHGVGMTLLGGNDDEMSIHFGDAQDANNGYIKYHHNYGYLSFGTNASEQLRIKEGNDNHFYTFDSTQTTEASYTMYIMSDKAEGNSGNRMIGFDNSGQGRGYIVAGDGDSDAPSFAAGSDRRLKKNITNYTGGYDKIKSIPVKQWDEIYSSKKEGQVGWIADELDDVFPKSVTGTPNATKEVKNSILDKDGRCVIESVNKEFLDKKQANGKWSDCTFHETATVPDYQYSSPLKFFPDVVQALQKAITKIESLEARVTTLEG